MEVQCPFCNKPLNVPNEYSGKPVKCEHCQESFVASPLDAPPQQPSVPPARPAKKPLPSPWYLDFFGRFGVVLSIFGLFFQSFKLPSLSP